MATHRGGRPRPDKKKGRGHWKGRSGARAAELAAGLANDGRGKIIDGSDLTEGKNRVWSMKEAQVAKARQAWNQDSRRRKGKVTGPILKPIGWSGGVAGTHHA